MSDVDFTCDRCGYTERPMNHDNPRSGGCTGTFVWSGSRVRCGDCGRTYTTTEEFWCTRCRQWHTEYTLS